MVTLLLVVIFHKIKTQHHFQIQVMEVQVQILVLVFQVYQTQEF